MISLRPNDLSCDVIRESIEEFYKQAAIPPADNVQELLDVIEAIKDEKLRTVLFVTAKIYLRGDLKDLVVSSRARALEAWGQGPFRHPNNPPLHGTGK